MSAISALPFSKIRKVPNIAGSVFLSGQMPFGDDGSVPDGIAAQTDLTLRRIAASLATEGLDLSDVVQVTVYLTHADDFAAFNAAYRPHFAEPFPTRTTVVAQLVVPTARVEITVVAAERARD